MLNEMHLTALFAVAFLLVSTDPAQAQRPLVRQGDRVRVAHDCGRKNELRYCRWKTGIVMDVSADTLALLSGDELTTHQLSTVVRLEVSRGSQSHEMKGAVIGAIAGGLLGMLVLGADNGGQLPCGDSDFVGKCFVAGAGGMFVGVLVGASIGGSVNTDRWEPVPLDTVPSREP